MNGRILVLGATGAVGRSLVERLTAKGAPVRAASRNPEAAQSHTALRVEWVRVDLDQPETFSAALAGIDRVFLIARPGDEHPERAAGPFIRAMKRAGTQHVVNLTALGVETRNDISLRKVELLLEESGLEFTYLRPNFFMQIFTTDPLLPAIRSTSAIRLPTGDARVSYIDARDIAAVAAAALTEPGHAGRAYTLTGPEACDHSAIAARISEAAGNRIGYEPVEEEVARAALAAAGFSPQRVERLIGFYRLVRSGFCAPVSGDVERVLGRPPRSFSPFIAEHSTAWHTQESAMAGR